MTEVRPAVTGILLAGGKSSRMGRDKGFVRVGNKQLFEYPLRVLEKLCDQILVSTCMDQGTYGNFRHVCDREKGKGPLMGIASCLEVSETASNIVLSYDMPLVEPRLFTDLLQFSADYDLILPAIRIDRPQPLCGIYNKNLLPVIKNQLANKNYAPKALIPKVKSRIHLVEKSFPYYTEELFLNINTEEDLNHLSSTT